MAQSALKLLTGDFYKKLEGSLDYAAIFVCWVFNISAAFITFNLTLVMTSSGPLAIVYTLYVWAITFTMSNGYWIYWTQMKMKAGPGTKNGITLLLAGMLIAGLFVIYMTVDLIWMVFLM